MKLYGYQNTQNTLRLAMEAGEKEAKNVAHSKVIL